MKEKNKHPIPDKAKVKELKRQKKPNDAREELPIDEGYSKTFLRVIVAVSVFLFAITLSGVLGINLMFEKSKEQVITNFTVQVLPKPDYQETNKELLKVVSFLETYPDVIQVSVLSDNELKALLSPWLGDNVDVDLLPIPKLLDVKINGKNNFDFKTLTVRLSEVSDVAAVNDHNLWLSRLLRFINSLKVLAVTVLILVAIVCVVAIVYAAKTGLNVHREIIEILHTMGATDEYIAINYVKQLSAMSIIAGVLGTVLAIPAIYLIGDLASDIEAGIFNAVTFGASEWFLILLLPFVSAGLVAVSSYVTVVRTLKSMV